MEVGQEVGDVIFILSGKFNCLSTLCVLQPEKVLRAIGGFSAEIIVEPEFESDLYASKYL